jgi:osmoprotectant transport system ATP-binding protein
MIEYRSVSRSYDGAVALQQIDLHIEPGRTTVLIGPSGCGKSTILRLMTGLVRPDAGEVLFNGYVLSPENITAFRRQMGYVIQEGGLFDHLTARGNVVLMAHYLKWSQERIEQRIRELADLTRLPVPLLDRYPIELSGGQRQRVSLMRALMLDPALLLLDEPLGALDPMVRRDLQADLKHIFQELKKTVVLVTHDIGEAAFFGDEILLLRDGRVVQRGTIHDLVEHPADDFVVRFINAQRGPEESLKNLPLAAHVSDE